MAKGACPECGAQLQVRFVKVDVEAMQRASQARWKGLTEAGRRQATAKARAGLEKKRDRAAEEGPGEVPAAVEPAGVRALGVFGQAMASACLCKKCSGTHHPGQVCRCAVCVCCAGGRKC